MAHKSISFLILTISLLLAACVPSQVNAPITSLPAESPLPSPITPAQVPSPTPDTAWIELTPASAPPGGGIQIQGYLPGGPTQIKDPPDPRINLLNVCWNGCQEGFRLEEQPLEWSATDPGHFSVNLSALSVPWLGKDGPVPLVEGDYSVGLQCLDPALEDSCYQNEAEASATFHLEEPVPTPCEAGQPCASLTFTPAQAAPGTSIQFAGWAPLVQVYGDLAFGYSLVMEVPGSESFYLSEVQQALDGTFTGSFLVPQQIPGQGSLAPGAYSLALQAYPRQLAPGSSPLLSAQTSITIQAANAWTAFSFGPPLWVQPSADLINRVVAVDPMDAQRLAYCAAGEIRLSPDGGQTWTSIPTVPVGTAAEASGYPTFQQDPASSPTCLSVILDPKHPDSFYATFETANKDYGAPPVFFMGYTTADDGATWRLVPPLSPQDLETFGGFWIDGEGTVRALYSDPGSPIDATASPLVQSSPDGGVTWSPGNLACPPDGPCLLWGSAPGFISGMGAPLPQPVLTSLDGGSAWTAPGLSVELRMPAPNQLVAFSNTQAVLLSGSGDYPVRLTQDGGRTWQVIALPPLPGDPEGSPYYPGLQILPNGSLLSQSMDGAGWMMLPPSAQGWCALNLQGLPSIPVLLQSGADQLWWISPESGEIEHLPIQDFACPGG
ncbi:MAG TPA: sialidase family protein [Anaerolineales bacterium]|nr:sialidase family protein [Anaerolineales bacterium]